MVRRSRTPQGVRGLKREKVQRKPKVTGRTPQGVRGLKPCIIPLILYKGCRTPQGVRGLKPVDKRDKALNALSHSARSAWIETGLIAHTTPFKSSHSARSAWIETAWRQPGEPWPERRTPQGVRGLKPVRVE